MEFLKIRKTPEIKSYIKFRRIPLAIYGRKMIWATLSPCATFSRCHAVITVITVTIIIIIIITIIQL